MKLKTKVKYIWNVKIYYRDFLSFANSKSLAPTRIVTVRVILKFSSSRSRWIFVSSFTTYFTALAHTMGAHNLGHQFKLHCKTVKNCAITMSWDSMELWELQWYVSHKYLFEIFSLLNRRVRISAHGSLQVVLLQTNRKRLVFMAPTFFIAIILSSGRDF